MRRLGIALALAMSSGSASALDEQILIFGGDGHKDFLGCLSCTEYQADSIWSDYSRHSWTSPSYGTWSSYGKYASAYGSHSACSEYARDPPVLVDRRGTYYGTLTISDTKAGSVCGDAGSPKICRALKVMCAK